MDSRYSSSLPYVAGFKFGLFRRAALVLMLVGAASCSSESATQPIDDEVIYFNCLQQLVERLREATCRMNVDDRTVEEVYPESITTWGPTISPDRRHVTLTPNSSTETTEFLVLDPTNDPVLTVPLTGNSLDRRWVATSEALVTADESGITVTPIDGSAAERIVFDPPATPSAFAVSPDGTIIASAVDGPVFSERPARFVMYDRATGEELMSVEREWVSSIAWSPSGRLAVSASALLTIDPLGDNEVFIGSDGDRFFGVAWSPDETQLAVIVGGELQIFDTESWEARSLTPAGMNVASGEPAWSPDGSRIVVAARTDEHPLTQLFLIDVSSGAIDRLTPADRDSEGYAFPVWR